MKILRAFRWRLVSGAVAVVVGVGEWVGVWPAVVLAGSLLIVDGVSA